MSNPLKDATVGELTTLILEVNLHGLRNIKLLIDEAIKQKEKTITDISDISESIRFMRERLEGGYIAEDRCRLSLPVAEILLKELTAAQIRVAGLEKAINDHGLHTAHCSQVVMVDPKRECNCWLSDYTTGDRNDIQAG